MRFLILSLTFMLIYGSGALIRPSAFAQSSDCTGDNCPPPSGSSGHDCEREKKEDTVS